MARARRIAHISAGGIVALLVGEYAVQHEELLAAAVLMGIEGAPRSVANDAGRPSNLAPVALEHLALDARQGRAKPGQVPRVHHDPLRQIGMDQHGHLLYSAATSPARRGRTGGSAGAAAGSARTSVSRARMSCSFCSCST